LAYVYHADLGVDAEVVDGLSDSEHRLADARTTPVSVELEQPCRVERVGIGCNGDESAAAGTEDAVAVLRLTDVAAAAVGNVFVQGLDEFVVAVQVVVFVVVAVATFEKIERGLNSFLNLRGFFLPDSNLRRQEVCARYVTKGSLLDPDSSA
jgi:hypothetical protein